MPSAVRRRGTAISATPDEFAELMEVNLLTTVRVTRAAAPHLLASGGHLVNVGSLASKLSGRYMGGYAASKFALAAYTEQLRVELGAEGLSVLLVCPGPIARDEPRQYAVGDPALPASAGAPAAEFVSAVCNRSTSPAACCMRPSESEPN